MKTLSLATYEKQEEIIQKILESDSTVDAEGNRYEYIFEEKLEIDSKSKIKLSATPKDIYKSDGKFYMLTGHHIHVIDGVTFKLIETSERIDSTYQLVKMIVMGNFIIASDSNTLYKISKENFSIIDKFNIKDTIDKNASITTLGAGVDCFYITYRLYSYTSIVRYDLDLNIEVTSPNKSVSYVPCMELINGDLYISYYTSVGSEFRINLFKFDSNTLELLDSAFYSPGARNSMGSGGLKFVYDGTYIYLYDNRGVNNTPVGARVIHVVDLDLNLIKTYPYNTSYVSIFEGKLFAGTPHNVVIDLETNVTVAEFPFNVHTLLNPNYPYDMITQDNGDLITGLNKTYIKTDKMERV